MKIRLYEACIVAVFAAFLGFNARLSTACAQTIQPVFSFTYPPGSPYSSVTVTPDGTIYGTTEGGGDLNGGTVIKVTTNGVVTTLASFADGIGSGSHPSGLTTGPDGNFYGTTQSGGTNNEGTVFKVTTNGVLTGLVNFNGTNGEIPGGGLTLGPDGNFYGTTGFGGSSNYGTIFRLTTNGGFTTLVNFNGTNGDGPSGLTLGPDGNLYGTTGVGGSNNEGTVFKLTTNGGFTTLVNFSIANGEYPFAGLTLGPDGNFYATSGTGGGNGYGGVFRMTTNGVLTTLVSFNNVAESDSPGGLTLGPDGNFYGTTTAGGSDSEGTVFRVTPNGVLTTLATFNGPNGEDPEAGLTPGPDGNLYGTTSEGGGGNYGTLFQITTNGVLTTLVSFGNNNNAGPDAGLILGPDGNLYGTTEYSGNNSDGTVFALTTNSVLTTFATFNGANGEQPEAGLTLGPDGSFYGTTYGGGSSGDGTVFRATTGGVLTTLVNFNGANGEQPEAGLTLGPDGNFYGTTSAGGSSVYYGTVFRMTTNGALTTLVNFNQANGSYPGAGLTLGPDGDFYGTTEDGGLNNEGTVFKLTTNGVLTTLVNFNVTNGEYPFAGLTLGPDGSFYGTTERGGSAVYYGTVFRMTTNGGLTTLASFTAPANGAFPEAGLTLGPDGNFYGTTTAGGSGGSAGTVFRVTTNGVLTTLASFDTTNGASPYSALTLGPDGNFYGTTEFGGGDRRGEIFRLNLPPECLQQPDSETISAGSPASFSVTPFGTGPFSYQWRSNNIPIPGATGSTLTIPAANSADDGAYSVIISNVYGSVTSSVASLTVATFVVNNIARQPNGSVVLNCTSLPNSTNRVWATTNLAVPADWVPIFTNTTTTGGTWQFVDTNAIYPGRYYRFSTP